MKRRADHFTGIAAALGVALLILDSKTALIGAQEGVTMCIQTVIPSLFPFFLFSILLTTSLMGRRLRILRPVCRLCRVPMGAESILIAGFLGGYPVGAQCVSQAFEAGQLSAQDARRMLGFCSNCGPAFLFGMAAVMFDKWWMPWVLWLIHIVSALIVGAVIPGTPIPCASSETQRISPVEALNRSVRIMAGVCGWVIMFRILIAFAQRWFLWALPTEYQVIFSGLMELSNGCVALGEVQDMSLRFMMCNGFLAFGGLCVAIQTLSITSPRLDKSLYFPGKILQCCISLALACVVEGASEPIILCVALLVGASISVFLRKIQNSGRNSVLVGV
jgi:hypothetical protein